MGLLAAGCHPWVAVSGHADRKNGVHHFGEIFTTKYLHVALFRLAVISLSSKNVIVALSQYTFEAAGPLHLNAFQKSSM